MPSSQQSELKISGPPPYSLTPVIHAGVVSRHGLRRMAYKHQPCLSMPSSELAARLLGLKALLPGCDVCFLAEDQPAAFLGVSQSEVEEQVAGSLALMQQGLAGANLNEVRRHSAFQIAVLPPATRTARSLPAF